MCHDHRVFAVRNDAPGCALQERETTHHDGVWCSIHVISINYTFSLPNKDDITYFVCTKCMNRQLYFSYDLSGHTVCHRNVLDGHTNAPYTTTVYVYYFGAHPKRWYAWQFLFETNPFWLLYPKHSQERRKIHRVVCRNGIKVCIPPKSWIPPHSYLPVIMACCAGFVLHGKPPPRSWKHNQREARLQLGFVRYHSTVQGNSPG